MGKRTEHKTRKLAFSELYDMDAVRETMAKLRKGSAHRDRTKYRRKDKHVRNQKTPDTDG